MKLPSRQVPENMMIIQFNQSFETMAEARKINPVKVWKDIESGRYCCQILVKKGR